jgi:tetratricopeptide (TPR) repeat protein
MTRATAIPATSEKSTLVGRDPEIAVIDAAVDAVTSGRGHVMLLTGEAGIGKSALARYAAGVASSKHIPVYWGFAWEAGGAPAYWPWTQLLRSLTKERNVPAALLNKLRELLPEVVSEEAADLNPDQARFQLLESARTLLEHICHDNPIVLILEDLHAADGDSLSLLQYLARHITSLPVLIIGTYREVEARALADADALWRTTRDAEVIGLEQLNEKDVRAYLAGEHDQEPSDEHVQRLLATTGGNPLFLTELVQVLNSDSVIDESRLPANVQQVIQQQIRLLPSATRELLAKASIQGRAFNPEALATYSGQSAGAIAETLEPALSAGFIRPFNKGLYRFSHALHRDVVYQGLGTTDCSLLHLAYADFIRNNIATGNEDRWSELAKHLDAAGIEHRLDAIEAWKSAASRAHDRLAFDEAAQLFSNAVEAFGSGPKFDPKERFSLLLKCANATILAGHVETGRQQCRDAFAIARTLEDPKLMSEAALTWGSVFIVAKVDKDMIAALSECLERLPADDGATRARLLARLAAALQPAPDPTEPMTLAREAIKLARSTGDDTTLYHVLRSAISALMDFAPVSERIPLNQEFGALATKLGDIPGRFRSNLRLMIDASEAGDRKMMVDAIDACDELARRIGLPHYLWRASSARAMQATIEGQFELATRLIEEAESHASKITDSEADIVLPIQRFAILTEWELDQSSSLEDIKTQLHDAFDRGTPDAEFFIAPFIRAHAIGRDVEVAQRIVSDKLMLERVFAYRDRFSLNLTGEIALLAEDLELAERVFDASIEHENDCVSLGLLGNIWLGPVATFLGKISAAFGRAEEAAAYYYKALETCSAMKAQPCVARIHLSLAEAEEQLGNKETATKHRETGERMCKQLSLREQRIAPAGPQQQPTSSAAAMSIEKQGDYWNVSFNGAQVIVRDSKGMQMICRLMLHPGTEVHVLDLSGSSVEIASKDAGPALDAAARAQYKQRISELREQLEEANEFADLGRIDQLQNELDALTRELSRAFGLGGRERRSGSDAERARVNVRRRIKDAIDHIAEQDADAGRYLESTIKTGSYCKYAPM